MHKDRPPVTPQDETPERRRLPRSKKVLFSGVITDLDGKTVLDCTIRDLSAEGAQIALANDVPVNSEAYLLDARNRVAHRARVVWSDAGRCGLAFVHTLDLSHPLPSELTFLHRILVETKLRQILRLTQQGISAEDARAIVGIEEEQLTLF